MDMGRWAGPQCGGWEWKDGQMGETPVGGDGQVGGTPAGWGDEHAPDLGWWGTHRLSSQC